jgi:hypothetical protein
VQISLHPIFAKTYKMEQVKKSRTKNWIYFTIWLAIMVVMLYNPAWRPFFWLALPGVVTHFSLGLDII